MRVVENSSTHVSSDDAELAFSFANSTKHITPVTKSYNVYAEIPNKKYAKYR